MVDNLVGLGDFVEIVIMIDDVLVFDNFKVECWDLVDRLGLLVE